MRSYDVFFWTVSFFICGVFAASLELSFLTTTTATLLAATLLLLGHFSPENVFSPDQQRHVFDKKKSNRFLWLAGLSIFVVIGSFYFLLSNAVFLRSANVVFDKKIIFNGVVVKNPERGNWQKLIIDLQEPYSGKILVGLKNYPVFNYGDLIKFEGVIKRPRAGSYADYLTKEGVLGTINYPKTEIISLNNGSKIKSFLFSFKEKIISIFQRSLPSESAAFLSGIILGERAEFSKKFKEAMQKSGTTHLVALSGYNITILVVAVAYFLGIFASQRLVFSLTVLIIISFVLMTGAEASVVRAAIMGGIILLAKQTSRVYSFRNAIAFAAFLMILENPRVLVFDVGFQLSFMALLGIIYLQPAIKKFLKTGEKDDWAGLFAWRENLLTTFSAQLAVLPLLVLYFGNFSLVSLIANLLILSLIPLTMALGFGLGLLGFISLNFSLVFGWFVNLFLSYEIFVVNFFGKLNIFQFEFFSAPLFVIYYLILVLFIIYSNRFKAGVAILK